MPNNNIIADLKAEDVSYEDMKVLEKLIQDLPDGELRSFLEFLLKTVKANKNLYIIATY